MAPEIIGALITSTTAIIVAVISGLFAIIVKKMELDRKERETGVSFTKSEKRATYWLWGIGGAIIGGVIIMFVLSRISIPFAPTPSKSKYLSELTPDTVTVGYGIFSVGNYQFTSTSPGDNVKKGDPIVAHGIEYSHGLYAHAPSKISYELGGQYSQLKVTLTMVDIGGGDGVVFVIKLDGKEIYRSNKMSNYSQPETIKVDISGGNTLELITEQEDNNIGDWAIWGNPILQ